MHKKPPEQTSPYELPLKRLIPARAVAGRYGTHLRTISRWVARGVIPPPDQIINERRYWAIEALEQADRKRTIEAGQSAKFIPEVREPD